MSAAVPLALAVLAAGGGSFFCQASERIEPGTWAVLQSRLPEDGGGELPSFHIRYMAEGEGATSQQMEWHYVPRWNERLGAPDTISFGIPIPRTDRKGFLRFSSDGKSWGAPQDPNFIRELRNIGNSWIEFQGFVQRHKFWSGSAWKVEAVDRSGRVMGSTDIRMPGPDRVQQAYARLRADLARFESDPGRHCEYTAPPDPGDFPVDDSDII